MNAAGNVAGAADENCGHRGASSIGSDLAGVDDTATANVATAEQQIVIGTLKGMAIKFGVEDVRSMGRHVGGVRGISLRKDDHVIGMEVVRPNASLLTVCEHGYGKRTPLEEYPIKGRGGQGVINIKTAGRNGEVVSLRYCQEGDDVMFITESGMIVRSPIAEMRPMGRATQGTRLVNLRDGDRLVAAEIVSAEDLEEEEVAGDEPASEASESSDGAGEPAADGGDDDGNEGDDQ